MNFGIYNKPSDNILDDYKGLAICENTQGRYQVVDFTRMKILSMESKNPKSIIVFIANMIKADPNVIRVTVSFDLNIKYQKDIFYDKSVDKIFNEIGINYKKSEVFGRNRIQVEFKILH